MLEGMTRAYSDGKISDLVNLYKSWTKSPPVSEVTGLTSHGYNRAEGAFEFTRESGKMSFTLEASEESPLHNPGVVISNWPGRTIRSSNRNYGSKGDGYSAGSDNKYRGRLQSCDLA